MNTFPLSIQVGATVTTLDMMVRTIRYDNGSAGGQDTAIRVRALSGGAFDAKLRPGDLLTLPEVVRGVIITSAAGITGLTGELTLGAGQLQSNRVTGEVSVIDGEVAKSRSGLAFTGSAAVGASPGVYGTLELWNPPGSGKRAIVSDILYSANVTGAYALLRLAGTLGLAAAGAPSKLIAGAVSTVLVGGAAAAAGGTSMELCLVTANTPLPRQFKQPLVVLPGTGIAVRCNTVNTDAYLSLQFTEESLA